MGLFGKKRTGTLKATDATGRHFTWVIPKFSSHAAGSTLDSENVVCFTKAKFHFHMALGSSGDIGVYIHYKSPPIPKYSYYFQNSKEEVMRQHTAHTVPADTERCGHWNVCNHREMLEFLGDDDTLTVRFSFDEDRITVKRVPENNTISVMWAIPDMYEQNLNPYSSPGFMIDNTLMVVRLDIKRAASSSGLSRIDNRVDIEQFVVFLFCRKGVIPPHSIEMLDGSGKPFARADKNSDGSALTLVVDKALVEKHVGADGVLFVQVDLSTGGNPLDALNLFGGPGAAVSVPTTGGEAEDNNANATTNDNKKKYGSDGTTTDEDGPGREVPVGDNKEMYKLMED